MKAMGAAVLLGVTTLFGQAQAPPSFEVASVRVSPLRTGTAALIATDTDPTMMRYSNITLKNLIAIAYSFDSGLIGGGPAWLDEQFYDLAAKLPPGGSRDDVPAMLRVLLAERFKLAVHRETKEQSVYFLVAGKTGPRLKQAQPADDQGIQQVRGDHSPIQIMRGRIFGHSMDVSMLAATLAHVAGYQVVDHTGLTGMYDINLTWTPEDNEGFGPELFAAIQEQLGLKLESGKGPVEMLVIDRADRDPGQN